MQKRKKARGLKILAPWLLFRHYFREQKTVHCPISPKLVIGIKYSLILYSALAELWGVMGTEGQLILSAFCYYSSSYYLSGRLESYRNPCICPTFSLSFSVLAVLSDDCSLAVQVNESVLSHLKEQLLSEKMVLSLFRSLVKPPKIIIGILHCF